ncbi:MAG: MvaI/BcnI family restriction endonuclease [Betaproteobacteria bacterium]|jgi:hypothetical protein
MAFESLDELLRCFRDHGATRVVAKQLAENDNSKQQIYLGGSFEVLQLLPQASIKTESLGKRPNFKAALNFRWLRDNATLAPAPHAQLILYPDYPEVRLSGFLRGSDYSPGEHMRPVPSGERKHFNSTDGRVLFFGVTPDKKIIAHLAIAKSAIAQEVATRAKADEFLVEGVLLHIPLGKSKSTKTQLLTKLREIRAAGWHISCRMNKHGEIIAYAAQNGGGYTLEALLGIKPNSDAAPDFLGWEIKAYGSGKVTLMTPEPDVGFYGEKGVKEFVRKYGHDAGDDVLYFTGIHRAGNICEASGQTLVLSGYDHQKQKIVDVLGGIHLIDRRGNVSAGWSFEGLIAHWSKKHAAAAYVPYEKESGAPPKYQYQSPVLLGEETEFPLYLSALQNGLIVYDPGSKVMNASKPNSTVKARSQFRIPVRNLAALYKKFEPADI